MNKLAQLVFSIVGIAYFILGFFKEGDFQIKGLLCLCGVLLYKILDKLSCKEDK